MDPDRNPNTPPPPSPPAMPVNQRWAWLGGLLALCTAIVYAMPPIPQDAMYHNFAEQRTILGIPHFGDVLSNLGFVMVGLIALPLFRDHCGNRQRFLDAKEAWPVAAAIFGIAIGGFASAYYHWTPGNETLMWDRLPMGIGFMSIFAMVIGERIDVKWGVRLLAPLVMVGVGSVLYWHLTELAGQGDLRLYALVQFFPMLSIPVMLWKFSARYTGERYLWLLIGWYAVAKVCEFFDHGIFTLTAGLVSGHTAKHLIASYAYYMLVKYVKKRQPS